MAKTRTEVALKAALAERTTALSSTDVEAFCQAAACSPATFYRSTAFQEFKARLAAPAPKAKGTKETLTKLRATVKFLANCVQALALRVETQDLELNELRQRANGNVTPFPSCRSRRA